jgi:hypothetical protein
MVVVTLPAVSGFVVAKSTTSSGASRPARTTERGASTRAVNVATLTMEAINAAPAIVVRFSTRRVRTGFSIIRCETNPRDTLAAIRTTSSDQPSKPMRSGLITTINGQ